MGNRVFLEFSHFDMEHGWYPYDSNVCTFDHLTIEERDSSDAVIRTDRYCQRMPKPMNTSNIVVLKLVYLNLCFLQKIDKSILCFRFKSDYSNSAGGFHLEYEMQGCGGILNKPEGSFTSPNYPNNYPHNIQCQWIIEIEYGHLIEITFSDFDFEASQDCKPDGLIVCIKTFSFLSFQSKLMIQCQHKLNV